MWTHREPLELSPAAVNAATTTSSTAEPTCPICQEEIGVRGAAEGWSVLPCGHRFGALCIKRWLGTVCRPMCPVCRTPAHHSCGHPVVPALEGADHCLSSTAPVAGGAADGKGERVASEPVYTIRSALQLDSTDPVPAPPPRHPAQHHHHHRHHLDKHDSEHGDLQQREKMALPADPRCHPCPLCSGRHRLARSSAGKRVLVSAVRVLKLLCRSSPRRNHRQRIARMEMELNVSYAKWWAQQEPCGSGSGSGSVANDSIRPLIM